MNLYKLFFTTAICCALQSNYAMEQRVEPFKLVGDRSLAVYEAIKAGNITSVIEHINVRNAIGQAALHRAAQDGNKASVELLLANGAEVDIKDMVGQTPLHLAAEHSDNIELLELLVSYGADINAQTKLKYKLWTPLHRAALTGHAQVAKWLIAHGVNVDSKDSKGQTPLFYAVMNKHKESIEVLIASGADINVQDAKGNTLVHFILKKYRKHKEMLLRYFSMYPQHGEEFVDMLIILLDFGAKTDLPNNLNQTAFDYCAQKKGFSDIEDIFRRSSASEKGMADTPMLKILIKLGDYPHLVRQLLATDTRPTQNDLSLARACEKRKIGKVLKTYLGIIGSNSTISKTGIRSACNLNMPEEIAALIAAYAVAE
jgi:ankyrin repeat protein